MLIQNAKRKLIANIRAAAAQAHGLLVPVSGGSDSAVCFDLCCQALGDKVLGVFVGDQLRCREWFEQRGGQLRMLKHDPNWEDAEIMRWAVLQTLAKAENRWLVSARNKTEDLLGTYSMPSRVATYLPIVGVSKTDVMRLCESIAVPSAITASSRRADPDCGRPQEMAEIPLEVVDVALTLNKGLSVGAPSPTDDQSAYLNEVRERNGFKKHLPKRGPRVSVHLSKVR
jgi:NH3-dependent NAD+ synthetase